MGLAGPKNRSRITNDPQNTTWANNTSRFGHRMLTNQGWTPGSSLGAENAAHSSHYTAGSHSHIRVLLKEDTLGLGAKRGSERAENFGLAALESVLGRLNGREEHVKKEQERLDDIEKRGFVARKFGFMNFVSGGFLIGDKIEKKIKKEEDLEVKIEVKQEATGVDITAIEKKKKKRKRDGEEDDEPRLKRKKKSMNLRAAIAEEKEAEEKKSKSKKDKRRSKKPSTSSSTSPAPTSEPLSDKAKRKAARAERRAQKEAKRLKKALKKASKETKPNTNSASSSESEDEEEELATSTTAPTSGTSMPTAAGLSFSAGGRHAVRQRYIRQKKMASMDPQAMREIFMVKSTS